MSAHDRVFHLRNGCSRVTCVSTSADLARFLPNVLSGAVVRSKTEMTEHPLDRFDVVHLRRSSSSVDQQVMLWSWSASLDARSEDRNVSPLPHIAFEAGSHTPHQERRLVGRDHLQMRSNN